MSPNNTGLTEIQEAKLTHCIAIAWQNLSTEEQQRRTYVDFKRGVATCSIETEGEVVVVSRGNEPLVAIARDYLMTDSIDIDCYESAYMGTPDDASELFVAPSDDEMSVTYEPMLIKQGDVVTARGQRWTVLDVMDDLVTAEAADGDVQVLALAEIDPTPPAAAA